MLKLSEYGRIGECVWHEVLPNGLKLFVVPKPGYKKSMAFFAVNYGGADRRFDTGEGWVDTPAGVAHFLEHKMFDVEGAENAMMTLSGRGASANAFTSTDMTAYHFESTDMFSENLELLLKFVSTPYFTQESVEKERGIIAQEIKMVEDDPDTAVYYGLLRCLYREDPVRDPVAGTVESIQDIDSQVLYMCHRAFYTPSNMVLVVVGDQDPARVRETAVEVLPDYNAPAAERDYGAPEKEAPENLHASSNMEVSAPIFMAGIKTGESRKGQDSLKFQYTASLALSILMGSSSPLYNNLYSQGLINDTFGFDIESTAGVSYLTFGGESRNPEQVCLRVLDEAERLITTGLDPDLFIRRKKAFYGRELRGFNSFDSVCYNIAVAAFDGYDYFKSSEIIESVTSEDVRGFLAKYMRPELLAISSVNEIER